ncbi:MAG: hypothetical protein PVH37_29640 [Desulfobacterales bacterium]
MRKAEGAPAFPVAGFPFRYNKASKGEVLLRRIAYRPPLAEQRTEDDVMNYIYELAIKK